MLSLCAHVYKYCVARVRACVSVYVLVYFKLRMNIYVCLCEYMFACVNISMCVFVCKCVPTYTSVHVHARDCVMARWLHQGLCTGGTLFVLHATRGPVTPPNRVTLPLKIKFLPAGIIYVTTGEGSIWSEGLGPLLHLSLLCLSQFCLGKLGLKPVGKNLVWGWFFFFFLLLIFVLFLFIFSEVTVNSRPNLLLGSTHIELVGRQLKKGRNRLWLVSR